MFLQQARQLLAKLVFFLFCPSSLLIRRWPTMPRRDPEDLGNYPFLLRPVQARRIKTD